MLAIPKTLLLYKLAHQRRREGWAEGPSSANERG